jgi:hypothetical protein
MIAEIVIILGMIVIAGILILDNVLQVRRLLRKRRERRQDDKYAASREAQLRHERAGGRNPAQGTFIVRNDEVWIPGTENGRPCLHSLSAGAAVSLSANLRRLNQSLEDLKSLIAPGK